jgi:hypothetical protein
VIYFAAGIGGLLLTANSPAPAVLSLVTSSSALELGVTLYAIIAGFFGGPRNWSSPVIWAVWLPLLVFELTFAVWLITKGVTVPARRQSA